MTINYNKINNTLAQVSVIALIAYSLNTYLYFNLNREPIAEQASKQNLEYIYFSIKDAFTLPKSNKPIKKKVEVKTIEVDKTPHDEIDIFKLNAIYALSEDEGWIVIQSIGSQRTQILKIGQEYRNYELKKVFAKYATFERRGKMYTLYLQKDDKYQQYAIDQEANYKDKIKVLDDKIQIKNTFVQKYVQNSNDIWREIAINENRINGKIEGFLITGMSYNSVFRRLGLQKGDVLLSVNNKKLNSYADALKVYKSVKSEKNIHLTIDRNGEIKEIDYELY